MVAARTATKEQTSDLPSVVHEVVAPFRAVLDDLQETTRRWGSLRPMDPTVRAVLEAYPKLMVLLEVEFVAYIKAYADKCDHLEDQLTSTRLHLRRIMELRGKKL